MASPPDLPILQNVSARVVRDGPARLRCEVPGSAVIVLLAIGSGVTLIMGLACLGLVLSGVAPPPLLASAVMGLVFGAVLGALARGRRRRSGTFLVDGGARTLVRLRGAREEGRWSFDDVVALRERVDLTDGMRLDLLPDLPRWLEAQLRDGARLRLAKGGRDELAAARRELAALGLAAAREGA